MLGRREHHPMTGRAESTITSNRFVKQGAAAKGIVHGTAGDPVLGISKFDITSGDVGTYHGDGDLLVETGEAIAIGNEVACGAAGVAMVADATDVIVAAALTAASAGAQTIEVRMIRGATVKA